MNREQEHRIFKGRIARRAFLAGWVAGRRAVGNKSAPQNADRAFEAFRIPYLRIKDTTAPASSGNGA